MTNSIRIAGGLAISIFNVSPKTEDSTLSVTRLFCPNFERVDHSLDVQNFGFYIFLLQ
jgi:hypothetical protein